MSIRREFMNPELPPGYPGSRGHALPRPETGMRLIENLEVRHVHGCYTMMYSMRPSFLVQNLDPEADSLYEEVERVEGRPFVLRDGTEILLGAPRWIQEVTGLTLDENKALSTEVDKLRHVQVDLRGKLNASEEARHTIWKAYRGLEFAFQEWRDRAWVTGAEVVLAMLLLQLAIGVPG